MSNNSWRDSASEGATLCQGYLLAKKNSFARIRLIDEARAMLAFKVRTGHLKREEFEFEIPYSEGLEMITHAANVVQKTRYRVFHRGYGWEVDVYTGANEGLIVAEIELDDESVQPPFPPWLGREVTGDASYSNRTLAKSARRDDYGQRNFSMLQSIDHRHRRRAS